MADRPVNSIVNEIVPLPSSQLTLVKARVLLGEGLASAMFAEAAASQAWEALDLAVRGNVYRGNNPAETAAMSSVTDLVAWADVTFSGVRKQASLDDATATLLRRGY